MNKHTEWMSQEAAILASGAMISLAILLHGYITLSDSKQNTNTGTNLADTPITTLVPESIKKDDHIYGNKDAELVLIEYSDTECQFCKRFHQTAKAVVDESQGKVAWVFRHYPLDMHPRANKEAEAVECAGELGGEIALWKYLDTIFEITPANNQLDPNELPKIAAQVGLDVQKFTTCLDSGKYASRVNRDKAEGATYGVSGTPHTFLMKKDGDNLTLVQVISGAQPKETVQAIIASAK